MFSRLSRGRVFASALTLSCVALGGCALPGAVPSASHPELVRTAPSAASTTRLFVWNESVPPAQLDEFPTNGGRPALRIPSPSGLLFKRSTVDSSGTLYMVGGAPYAPNIGVYKPGSTKPFATIVKGVGSVIGLTTDAKNDLYVLNAGGPLVKYAPGAIAPAFATYSGLCATGYGGPAELAADRSGNVYVGANCGKRGGSYHAIVSEYGGGTKVKRTISFDTSLHPIGFTVDGSGRLYVAYADSTNNFRLGIAEYASGATKPATSFYFGPSTPAYNVTAGAPVVDDSTGMLYQTFNTCPDDDGKLTCTSSIYLYPRGATVPSRTLNGPPNATFGTPVLDAAGNLYVESTSPSSPLITIQRYEKGTWTKTSVLGKRNILLAFAWPTVSSSRAFAGGQFGVGRP